MRGFRTLTPSLAIIGLLIVGCGPEKEELPQIITVLGPTTPAPGATWLSHEHILVDFIGADSIEPDTWDHDEIMGVMVPYLEALKAYDVKYFVDPTPNYLGRDVELLQKISQATGLQIITNTGYYGARNDAHVPSLLQHLNAREMAGFWISEFRQGIGGTDIRPGFIKIGIDNSDPLDSTDAKLVRAAAMTHIETGLTIAAHTGAAKALWPELEILAHEGVSPTAFIWVHAQNEEDNSNYLRAAQLGCWISLDGVGWGSMDRYVDKLVFLRDNGLLDQVLISHDAGWYDPQKSEQNIKPYTPVFEELIPRLLSKNFSTDDISQLLSKNPAKAFAIQVRLAK